MPSSPHTKRSANLFFELYNGAGNRFLIFDGREENLEALLAPYLCKKYGVDGLLILTKSYFADFGMKILNADGSSAEMCGNGLRCLILYLYSLVPKESYTIETPAGVYRGGTLDSTIWTSFLPPSQIQKHLPIFLQNFLWNAAFLKVGVPHLILFLDEGPSISLEKAFIEANLRTDLFPQGVNLNGIVKNKKDFFSIRTIERGVGRETLACGTGTVASGLSLVLRNNWSSPMTAKVASQDLLEISFIKEDEQFHSLELRGPAQKEGDVVVRELSKESSYL